MDEKEFFEMCEEKYQLHYKNPKSFKMNNDFRKGRETNNLSDATLRHEAGKVLLHDINVFHNIKTEYIEKFLELYPVDWSKFSELPVLTEEIIRKHVNKLALSKIFAEYRHILSEDFIERYNDKLGLVRRVELNLISIEELMMEYPDSGKAIKKKIKSILDSDTQGKYSDAIKLYIMLN